MSDPSLVAVLLSLFTMTLNVLLPLIPAVVIYKLFPQTKVAVKGPFRDLQLNASGAFAGYFVVAIFAFQMTDHVQRLITGLTTATTEVRSRVILENVDGSAIPAAQLDELFSRLQPRVIPPHEVVTKDEIRVSIPRRDLDHAIIQFSLPGFTSGQVQVAQHLAADPSRVVTTPVRLRRIAQPYKPGKEFPILTPIIPKRSPNGPQE